MRKRGSKARSERRVFSDKAAQGRLAAHEGGVGTETTLLAAAPEAVTNLAKGKKENNEI